MGMGGFQSVGLGGQVRGNPDFYETLFVEFKKEMLIQKHCLAASKKCYCLVRHCIKLNSQHDVVWRSLYLRPNPVSIDCFLHEINFIP